MENANTMTEDAINEIVQTPKKGIIPEKEFDGMLSKISKSGKVMQSLVHDAAVQAYLQALEHDNYTPATKLMIVVQENLSAFTGVQLRQWFQKNGPFRWVKTEDKTIPGGFKFRKSNSENATVFNTARALREPWFVNSADEKERINRSFNADSAVDRIERVIRDLKKVVESGKYASEADSVVMPKLLEALVPIAEQAEKELKELTPTKEEQKEAA